jgi:hypothetical protein
MREAYINECKQIKQNAEYTAEAHHAIACFQKRLALGLQTVPAGIAAFSGAWVAAGQTSTQWLWLTVISAVVASVASVLNPNKAYAEHLNAAKNFTTIKHDARALHQAFGQRMTDEAFAIAVENLHEKYNDLVKVSPPTTDRSFKKAQQKIQSNAHEPDKDKDGNLK